jgi:hypothetical protein
MRLTRNARLSCGWNSRGLCLILLSIAVVVFATTVFMWSGGLSQDNGVLAAHHCSMPIVMAILIRLAPLMRLWSMRRRAIVIFCLGTLVALHSASCVLGILSNRTPVLAENALSGAAFGHRNGASDWFSKQQFAVAYDRPPVWDVAGVLVAAGASYWPEASLGAGTAAVLLFGPAVTFACLLYAMVAWQPRLAAAAAGEGADTAATSEVPVHMGDGQPCSSSSAAQAPPSDSEFKSEPKASNGPSNSKRSVALADLIAIIKAGTVVESQQVLAQRWRVHKGTVSKWLKVWESAGQIVRVPLVIGINEVVVRYSIRLPDSR